MRIVVLSSFLLLAIASIFFVFKLKFTFDFEQFFPQGDQDLIYFKEFIEAFETDDNFLLVAVRRENGVFDSVFLNQFHDFSLAARQLPFVEKSQSLTQMAYPVKTPFSLTSIPVIHLQEPTRYASDKKKILADERFVHNLISEDGTTLVLFLKTVESIQLDQANVLMAALDQLVGQYDFEEHHYLGRAYFQKELVDMQKREVTVSAIISGILVSIILLLIFRRLPGVLIALVSIGLGMLLFMGFLGVTGRELNAMAALYPVLMIIVGTSDVIHIMSKYVDELRKGNNRRDAIRTTIREIGLATLLTSLTTAIGFATLFTSKVYPIRDFGINAAIGVLIAYLTVIGFTTYLLTYFKTHQIIKLGRGQAFWEKAMEKTYQFTLNNPKGILVGSVIVLLISFWGISRITTNYNIINNMPIGRKITEDFYYFERALAGFRPMEFAVTAQNGYKATDFEVIKEVEKLEDYLRQFSAIRAIGSITTLYKSINQMMHNNRTDAYEITDDPEVFERQQKLAEKIPQLDVKVLVSKDGEKARITSRINDIGADSIKNIGQQIDQWIVAHTDSSIVKIHRTGTGLIIDKNAEYVRQSLIQGLGLAILIVSLLMAILFRNATMLLISLIPNIFPLLLAGALLGFLGIELEAGVAIVFAVIFGIAVDDTIHFLSKYKLTRNKGHGVEEALHITFLETGKAIVLTTVILFFGFLVMLFSIHPPSVTIGLLISLTLGSALISDLLLIPVLIRWWMPKDKKA
ncbi:MAG TPA: MMPL family transporter [Saprospiraceae bacterium]|nr:MMPL family transporter [Saprospiraceae bacterium]HMQ82636.1 MMPL family transporter [Saprospiraceae bacterium]